MVEGTDIDLVLDGIMVDVKMTKYLQMKREYINQLLGYYVLYLLGGVTEMPKDHIIRELAVYFSRHGYLYSNLFEFSSWFRCCAGQQYSGPKI